MNNYSEDHSLEIKQQLIGTSCVVAVTTLFCQEQDIRDEEFIVLS